LVVILGAKCSLAVFCRNAYGGEPPEVVEPIRAVPDFTSWLVVGGKVDVTGMARRVPDVDRPHRFEITATEGGVAGSRGAETSYKNLAADNDYMNVVAGVLQPLQWLQAMPSAQGPQMQGVQTKLRQALVEQQPSVYRNFAFNETAMGAGMFTEADIAWYDAFYKMIGTDESLDAAMFAVYKWSAPGARERDPSPVGAVRQTVSLVPPMCHQNFTQADRKRMIAEEVAANATEEGRVDKLVADYLGQKDHKRGIRVISKSSQDLVARKERALIAASIGVPGSNSSNQPAAPEPECVIVGAAKPGEDVSGNRYSTMYLVQWAGFVGQDNEYSWLNDSDLGGCYDSLHADLDGEQVHGGSAAISSWWITAWFVCSVLVKQKHGCM
jgi:hypothetical protein